VSNARGGVERKPDVGVGGAHWESVLSEQDNRPKARSCHPITRWLDMSCIAKDHRLRHATRLKRATNRVAVS
jgi:hypothetical protein